MAVGLTSAHHHHWHSSTSKCSGSNDSNQGFKMFLPPDTACNESQVMCCASYASQHKTTMVQQMIAITAIIANTNDTFVNKKNESPLQHCQSGKCFYSTSLQESQKSSEKMYILWMKTIEMKTTGTFHIKIRYNWCMLLFSWFVGFLTLKYWCYLVLVCLNDCCWALCCWYITK